MEKEILFADMTGLRDIADDYSQLGDYYLFSRISAQNINDGIISSSPVKFGGMTVLLVTRGRVRLNINLDSYCAEADTVLVINSGQLVTVEQANADFDACMLFVAQGFLADINININAMKVPSVFRKPEPVIKLSSSQRDTLMHYFDMLCRNADDANKGMFSKHIARNLMAAIVYTILQISYQEAEVPAADGSSSRNRRLNYVSQFVKLVHVHHRQERSVAFYANKMFISPKYLSLLIKETTGKSAARWIDEFVIMAAKNLLRFSGKNVQQVAYELNFNNQSSFGKYFKHLTGMSPTEYQKS